MNKTQNNYSFVELNKKQYIIGWILIPLYLGILRYCAIEPLLKLLLGENSDITFLSGYLKSFIILIIMLIIFKDNIKQFIKDFCSCSVKENVKWVFKGIGIFCLIRVIYALVFTIAKLVFSDTITKLVSSKPANEEYLKSMQEAFPIVVLLFVVIVAPVLEELIFRYVVYNTFRKINKYFAIIGSSIFFSSIHLFSEILNGQYMEAVFYGLGYMTIALAFALIYEKRRNIIFTIIIHMLYNLIATLM